MNIEMPPDEKIKKHQKWINYFRKVINKTEDENNKVDWNDTSLARINKSVRCGNFYMLDLFEILIKKKEFGKNKSAFGWRWETIDGEDYPVSIHIDPLLIKTGSPDLKVQTLTKIRNMFPAVFEEEKGLFWKGYTDTDPYLNIRTLSYE
jgi:hypothetical protein